MLATGGLGNGGALCTQGFGGVMSGDAPFNQLEIKLRSIDSRGVIQELTPTKISARISENAATEITLEFDNTDGIKTNYIVFDDIIEIEADP